MALSPDVQSVKEWLLDEGVLDERTLARYARATEDLGGEEEHLIDIAYDSIDSESRRVAARAARGSIPDDPPEVLFQCGFLRRDPMEMPEKVRTRLQGRPLVSPQYPEDP